MIKIPKRLLPIGNAQSDISFDEKWVSQNDYKRYKETRERLKRKDGRIRCEEKWPAHKVSKRVL